MEYFTISSAPRFKGIARICLVDQDGRRVLDTFIKPIEIAEGDKIQVKDPQKMVLIDFARDHAPKLKEVVKVLRYLVEERDLVGYHLPLKLSDLGIDFAQSV